MNTLHDLSGFVCPLSSIKATQVIDSLAEGETIQLILGDTDSLRRVVRELKTRGIRPGYEQESENKFVLTITKKLDAVGSDNGIRKGSGRFGES